MQMRTDKAGLPGFSGFCCGRARAHRILTTSKPLPAGSFGAAVDGDRVRPSNSSFGSLPPRSAVVAAVVGRLHPLHQLGAENKAGGQHLPFVRSPPALRACRERARPACAIERRIHAAPRRRCQRDRWLPASTKPAPCAGGVLTCSFAVMHLGTIANTPRPAVTAIQSANSESNGRLDTPNACPTSPLWVSKGVAYRMPRAARQPRASARTGGWPRRERA